MLNRSYILAEVSNRHVHLCRRDVDALFGKGYKLNVLKQLSQPGQFAAKEKITLVNGDRKIKDVRVLGPERKETQVELSRTDAIHFKIDAPLKESGNLNNTPGINIEGPKGCVELKKGVIVAQRHLHASEQEAKEIGIEDGQKISVKIKGKKGVIFDSVLVRVHPKYKLAVHLDTDEGNAACIKGNAYGELITKNGKRT
jgi:putative phosphotransacetylase